LRIGTPWCKARRIDFRAAQANPALFPDTMPQPDLVIFDCDGVLVDSEVIASRVEAELLTQAGYEITGEELSELYAGLTFKDIMLRIEDVAAIPFKASLIDQAEDMVDRRLRAEVRAIEGAHEAVTSVAGKRCICSNSRTERIGFMLEKNGLAQLFSGRIFSSLETPSQRPKPAPDVFLYAAQSMGANPASTFVIEDSVHGIAGAKTAGMRVIGFTGGAHSYPGHADVLTEAGAETVIRRWADFRGVIAALSEWSAET
jgi:HAD superfamily hydrolase (TIGR01509 family)